MTTYPLGWQSWSPPTTSWHHLPSWDYCPTQDIPIPFPKPLRPKPPLNGWCSWYALGWNISHQKILDQARLINQNLLSIDYLLIDDGWTTWGDWQNPNPKLFPLGIKETARSLNNLGFQTGLWIAPFLANRSSQLLKKHPDWFIHNKRGKYIQGLKTAPIIEQLSPQKYLLDYSNPEVIDYLHLVINIIISTWNINVLKLDFLYAPYFDPRLSNATQASHAIRNLLQHIKRQHPHVTLIVCGCPFADALNNSDVIRFSKDATLPPPAPKLLRKFLYLKRIRLMQQKYNLIPSDFSALPDPDVRMFSLDTRETDFIWDTIQKSSLTLGDDLTQLSLDALQAARIWLQKNPSSRSSSPR